MSRIHCLKHVECLSATHLADDDPVRPHAQRIADELALRDVANAFYVGRPRLHLNDMRLLKAQFDDDEQFGQLYPNATVTLADPVFTAHMSPAAT